MTNKAQLPEQPRLILASTSPRRAMLMREHGYDVELAAPTYDEATFDLPNLSPVDRAKAISEHKARSVIVTGKPAWILSGDTIAALNGRIFGKPVDRADASNILGALAGTTHHVITGVTLLDTATGDCAIRHDTTAVTMRSISPDALSRYLDSGAWKGKAGAFGIQDSGDEFIERIEGSFTNVVGFPMELIRKMLSDWGYQLPPQPNKARS